MSQVDTTYTPSQPDVEEGIEYWSTQPASYDGVLELSTVPSAIRPLKTPPAHTRRTRALDVGAGVGRVTSDVLLHLVSDVVLMEPVEGFVNEAWKRGASSAEGILVEDSSHARWKGIQNKTKSVTVVQGTLQALDPLHPLADPTTKLLGRLGYEPAEEDLESGFDVIWCQWCLGHLSNVDLVAFFKRCRQGLRDPDNSIIVVKENLCHNAADGGPETVFDPSDSSLTRYFIPLVRGS
ncbi:hypothetical protein PHLCEN_2v8700 [Hermanssonia centrifuga]|uniref:Alpha N-terminal protein methyltransferase 1 n=1 Tax=Hermanssonia centrifuga TaxID=98765 RepID=A0A2R6NSX3_9APHY|nr:hypothetical protein PHLCEN_2v8700 [Hermanssonia centrifuga]